MKVLNLYAGIGGNRKLWPAECKVTAVEYEEEIAAAYKHFFPKDKVVVADAHQYLIDHYKEFDFIWSSPPCPTHGRIRKNVCIGRGQSKPVYPDMRLYQEIIFLKHHFEGKWVVENTKSYYDPLIKPFVSGGHYFWSNFHISNFKVKKLRAVRVTTLEEKQKLAGFDVSNFSFSNIRSTHKKDKVLNNCVDAGLGLHIFKEAYKIVQEKLL